MFHIAIFVVLVIVAILGTVGNLLIIGAVLLQKRLRRKGNAFIINLAIADLIITAVIMPLGLAQSQHHERIFGDLLCDFNAFLILTTCGVSIQSLMMIAIERYIHVCRVEIYNKVYTPVLLAVYIIFTWVYTMVWTIHGWTGWTKFVYGNGIYVCLFDGYVSLSYNVCLSIFCMLLPMLVLSVCYVCIFRTVRASKASMEAYKSKSNKRDSGAIELVDQSERRTRYENKVLVTLFTIVVLFVIFWIPAAIVLISSGLWRVPKILYVISVWAALCNSCINSIVYGAMNRNFQKGYKEIIQSLVYCKRKETGCSCTSVGSFDVKTDSPVQSGSVSPPKSSSSTATETGHSDGTSTKRVTENNICKDQPITNKEKRRSWTITYQEECFVETKI